MRTATCRIFHGTGITTAAPIPVEDLIVGVGWLGAIVAEIDQVALAAAWTDFRIFVVNLDPAMNGRQVVVLQARHDLLIGEAGRKDRRRTRLNPQIAQLAARWIKPSREMIAGAGIIALEDLRNLVHRRRGRSPNSAVNAVLPGQINQGVTAVAANAGLKVIIVPARGTSSTCPRGASPIRHRSAPNGPTGYTWALCPGCGLSADRDHSAAGHITVRGALISVTGGRHWRQPETTVRLVRTRRAALTAPGPARAKPARPATTFPTRRRREAQRQAARRPAAPHPAWGTVLRGRHP